jgi:hypothetical protein
MTIQELREKLKADDKMVECAVCGKLVDQREGKAQNVDGVRVCDSCLNEAKQPDKHRQRPPFEYVPRKYLQEE